MPPSCRNADLSDQEMLANIMDAIDADGYASTTEIARVCGFTVSASNGRRRTQTKRVPTPAQKVATRLAYMRDIGLLESFKPDGTTPYIEPGDRDTRWRLTDTGMTIFKGKLTKTVASAVERMDPGAQNLLMRQLMVSGYLNGGRTQAFALRREYQHNLAQRKLTLR